MIEFNPSDVTLLIVEDKPDSQDVLTYFLKPSGYQIHAVNDGVSAMEFINRQLPDIILLDAMLPKLNGFQVCEKLKKNPRTFHIPIIMITALKDLKDKIRSLEAGADDFITKPIDSVELTVRVKSLLKSKFYFEKLQQQNEELVRQKAALEEEDRLKEQLTELIVHDMRSPLNQISINLQMMEMLRKGGQAVESEKYAKRIKIGLNAKRTTYNRLLSIFHLFYKRFSNDINYCKRTKAKRLSPPFRKICPMFIWMQSCLNAFWIIYSILSFDIPITRAKFLLPQQTIPMLNKQPWK